ncbi:hypothetical protein HYFRA_00012311 [Hymenoscyphus fraxineus]|uniref:MFS general substrate transporter n=1 Tax=Hymenoscyphus fraxineus TaxID=746836 RepID=A0A9N9PRF3_9HELO|nr:hypothetical protein HYFRA_00012311 [Hymenoscyphus fraxineus]
MASKTADSGFELPTGSIRNGSMEEDKATGSRITRKIDIRLVPMLCALYLTAYLDRTNVGNAKLLNLEKDLKMPSNGYNTAVWVFFLTFVVMEVSSNMLMAHSKIPPNWWLALGIVTMCQGFVTTPGQIYACRAIMGIFEGSLSPAAALMKGSYYRRHEFPIRYACFTTSFLAYAINFMDGTRGISYWRWIFILEGLYVFVALLAIVVLPRFPAESKLLTLDEKEILLHRLSVERGNEAENFKGQPWVKFLFDWQTWLNIVIYFGADMSAAAISQLSPTILSQLGWKANEANLRNVLIWLLGAVFSLAVYLAAGKWGIRFPLILLGSTLCTIGWPIQLAQVDPSGVRYFSLHLVAAGAFAQLPLLVAWLSANTVGRPKKAVVHTLQIGFGNSANFVSANVFIKDEAPKYKTGFKAGLIITVVGLFAACVMECEGKKGGGEEDGRKRWDTI